jgi:DNA-binding transcriptional MerR regulator
LAEYRLDELARISGVSTRNIRAYRERGLLDPPRRVGRSAYYDDYQLSQLRTINQLLRRGFNSAHIAEFFASMRQGADLADILGIQRALLGPRAGDDPEEGSADVDDDGSTDRTRAQATRAIDIDPHSDTAAELIDRGLAERRQGRIVVVDTTIAEIIGRAPDQPQYVRALLRFYESSRDAADFLATVLVRSLEEIMQARLRTNGAPEADEVEELGQITQDFRELWGHVLSNRLEESMQRQLSSGSPAGHSAGALLSELLRL